MWRAVEWGLSTREKDMAGEENATSDAQETLGVTVSLKICMKLLDHGWKSAQSGKVPWTEARDTGIEGCMGLVTMSAEKHFQDLTRESHMWFVLFLTMTGISLTAVAALIYLISTMRKSISLKKCLLSPREAQEKRPDPKSMTKSLRFLINTRPKVRNWASPHTSQQPFQLPSGLQPQPLTESPAQQHHLGYPVQPHKYPITVSPVPVAPTTNCETQILVRTTDHDETKIMQAKMKADMEEKYMEYQRSLWDLQKAIPNGALGTPTTIYPALPATPEGEGS